MCRRIACALIVSFCVAAADPAVAPSLPKAALFKPTFLTLNGSWSAGTAFVVKYPDSSQLLFVTPDHLFGPDGGLETQMSPDDIAKKVCGAVGLSMQDKKTIITAGTCQKIADARPTGQEGTDKDLAVFPLAQKQDVDGFEFAASAPSKGASIWMYARLRTETEPRLFPAVVLRSSDRELVYRFTDKPFNAAGTSGAPILDSDGKVVGMNVSGGEKNGIQFGFANPATAIRAELAKISKP